LAAHVDVASRLWDDLGAGLSLRKTSILSRQMLERQVIDQTLRMTGDGKRA
jgi:hypothetical protein